MPFRFLVATCLAVTACSAQPSDLATFGTTVVIPGGLTGKIYFLEPGTMSLPKFEGREPVGTIYAKGLYIPPREFTEGFPFITDRVEWFAIDFTGRFYVDDPGAYRFALASDDGSKLYIDKKLAIDNDGIHGTESRETNVKLAGGMHSIRLSYFQGPRYHLSLMLSVAGPGDRRLHPFNTDDFKPPSDPADWKYGDLKDLDASDPDAGRRRLTAPAPSGQFVPVPVQVLAHGKPARDLKPGDFLVYDNQERKDIVDFSFGGQALDIILLIDGSAAMRSFHQRLAGMAEKAMSSLRPQDRVGVMVFEEKPQFLTLGLASRVTAMAALQKLRPGAGESELNGSIAVAALYLQQYARPEAARVIVILTLNDGRREVTDRAARDELWQANVTLSGLIARDGERTGDADIRPLINATGGDMLEMDRKNIPLAEAFQRLRERYFITYRAPDGEPKTIHNLSVDLTPETKARLQDYQIRVRSGYVIEAR